MARHLFNVGTGDYWQNLVQPSFEALIEQGLIKGVTTIDIRERDRSKDLSSLRNAKHIKRREGQNLSEIVDNEGHEEPFVVLAHINELHVPDTLDLVRNSRAKPRILLEKPYALDEDQLHQLRTAMEEFPNRIGLLEYYLTMKGVPLLLLFRGVVKKNSFYFEDNGILRVREEGKKLRDFSGLIEEEIGRPIYVVVDVLEGKGKYGTVEHRDPAIVDRERGGGMIQDLGIHALTPLMGLELYLGGIDARSLSELKIAFCEEYFDYAKKYVDPSRMGESYAEMNLITTKGVPVYVSLGKYVERGKNQRRIIITGTRGVVLYDLTNNVLSYQSEDDVSDVRPLIEADKIGVPKYLAVLRAGMETLEGRNPFRFDPTKTALNAQEVVLGL